MQNLSFDEYVAALEALSGQTLGPDWPAWIEWYGGTHLAPPPGFTSWKGRLLAQLELPPYLHEWLRREVQRRGQELSDVVADY